MGGLRVDLSKEATWSGDREFIFDMLMVFGSLCYLVLAGFIPALPALIYVIVGAITIVYLRSKSITMLFAFPLVLLPFIIPYEKAPRAAWIYAVWALLALLFDRRRFRVVVTEFIVDAKALRK